MTRPPVAGAAARAAAPARRPVGPRRISGPARRPAPVPSPPVRRTLAPSLPRHGLRRLVDHPLLDRLIRGRAWIGIVAFALIGIVGMQLTLLKLNAGIGRSVQQAAALEGENSLLSAQVSTLRADELRKAGPSRQGMVFAPPGDVRYLTAGNGDAAQAAASIIAPRVTAVGGSSSQSAGTPALGGASGSSSQTNATTGAASGTASGTTANLGTGNGQSTPAGGGTTSGGAPDAGGSSTAPAPSGASAPGSAAGDGTVGPSSGAGTPGQTAGGVDGGAPSGSGG